MRTSENIKREMKDLVEKQADLVKLASDTKNIVAFGTAYQHWYSRAYKLVESLAPERLEEFVSYYLINPNREIITITNYVIQDYLQQIGPLGTRGRKPPWDANSRVVIRITNQIQIIASLSSRVDNVLQDVTGHLFAELQDSELRAAVQLKKVNSRAAGAVAGVVLERHLQRVAVNHKIPIRKQDPTIADLNDPLKQKGVYDVPMWRKIQLLADIRNLCTHKKTSEPTDEQVDELIAGVNSVIKSVF